MGMYFSGISHVPWGYFPWEQSWGILPMVSIFYRETHGEYPWERPWVSHGDVVPWCPISTGKPMVNSYGQDHGYHMVM